jgi:hypothetical protein
MLDETKRTLPSHMQTIMPPLCGVEARQGLQFPWKGLG